MIVKLYFSICVWKNQQKPRNCQANNLAIHWDISRNMSYLSGCRPQLQKMRDHASVGLDRLSRQSWCFPSACCAKSATAAGCKNVLKNQVVANRLANKTSKKKRKAKKARMCIVHMYIIYIIYINMIHIYIILYIWLPPYIYVHKYIDIHTHT